MLLALTAVAGVTAGGSALPASAAGQGDSGPKPVVDTADGFLHVRGEGIALGPGKVIEKTRFAWFTFDKDAAQRPTGLRLSSQVDGFGKAGYQIVQDGVPTPYWTQITFTQRIGITAYAECAIFKGEPGTDGVTEPTWDSPFQCERARRGWDYEWDFRVEPAGTQAEASGTIAPTGVALKDGVFRTDAASHRSGAHQLSAGESTRFDAVLARGDRPFYENQARTEWAYQIVDQGVGTGFWAAGVSTNYRNWRGFTGDGRCAIYSGNPLDSDRHLDDSHPNGGTPYSCTAVGQHLHDNAIHSDDHFDATFTVGRK